MMFAKKKRSLNNTLRLLLEEINFHKLCVEFFMFCHWFYCENFLFVSYDQSHHKNILSYNLISLPMHKFLPYIQNEKFVPNSTSIFFIVTLSEAQIRYVNSIGDYAKWWEKKQQQFVRIVAQLRMAVTHQTVSEHVHTCYFWYENNFAYFVNDNIAYAKSNNNK